MYVEHNIWQAYIVCKSYFSNFNLRCIMRNFLKFQGLMFLTLLVFDICFILIFSRYFGITFCVIILGFLNFGFVFEFCLALWQFYKGTYKEQNFSSKLVIKEFALYFVKALLLGFWLILEAICAVFSALG